MKKFAGFDEFSFFRAINPAFHVGKDQGKRTGIVVGDQDTFQGYKELYDCEYFSQETSQEVKCEVLGMVGCTNILSKKLFTAHYFRCGILSAP